MKMFDREKLLLIGIVSFTLYSQVTHGNVKLLDVSSNVVDDQYNGCREEAMNRFIQSGLFKEELNNSKGLQKAWRASSNCSFMIPGGIKEHTAALSALHHADADFMKVLNKAVETQGANLSTYENDFQFKSLHFLLMDSMMLLNHNKCRDVFAFLGGKNPPKVNSTLRFASFTMVHSDLQSLGDLDDEIVLKITSCFFVVLDGHICEKNIYKTLLSPAEVFTVESVASQTTVDSEYTKVTLKHHSVNSTHNCLMFPRSAASVPSWSFAPLLLASSLFILHL